MKSAIFIDDDLDFLYLIERLKSKMKIPNLTKLITFGSGLMALDYLKANLNNGIPYAMFIDLNMPVMNGFQFLEEFKILKDKHSELNLIKPIAIITSSTSEKDKESVSQIGIVNQYFVKDIDIGNLAIKINELLI